VTPRPQLAGVCVGTPALCIFSVCVMELCVCVGWGGVAPQFADLYTVIDRIACCLGLAWTLAQEDAARTQHLLASTPRVVVWPVTLLRDTIQFLPYYGGFLAVYRYGGEK
jgi:hypothetical protein